MLDFSRNSDHLYRLYITGYMMLRDGLEDIPRRYPDCPRSRNSPGVAVT